MKRLYVYDFRYEVCFSCRHCKYELDLRKHYCDKDNRKIENPHGETCGCWDRV